jgi:hypothetical protein
MSFFKNFMKSYEVTDLDMSIGEKIKQLEDRIIKLEDENISLTNEIYRLENSLEARIDIVAEHCNVNYVQ